MTMATPEEEHNAEPREPRSDEESPKSEDEDETETKFVEWDDTGRFGRTTQLLGRGTYKTCTWPSTRRRDGTWRGTRSR